MRDQEAAMLDAINRLGYNPMSLPEIKPGKAGVKKEVRISLEENPLFDGEKIFDRTWDQLSGRNEIAYVK